MEIPVVASPDEVTADWLTRVLRESGFAGRVRGFSKTSIGTGQVGENIRFSLEGEDLPASVVGKFPSPDPASRKAGVELQNYMREVFYYQQLDATLDIQTPRVFFCGIRENHDFVILMEDLAPGLQGDQLAGCSPDDAALALTQLARLQGPRYADSSLRQHPLLAVRGETTAEGPGPGEFYRMMEPGFLARYADRLTDDEVRVTRALGARMDVYDSFYEGPPCLIHVDFRLDNMMFGGPYPLAVVDWQSIALGCPVQDVSYFLGTSLTTEDRRKEETQLLKVYLDVLKSYDVRPAFDDCYSLYRHYAPGGLIMAVLASMLVGETARGNDMFMAMATRSARMMLDFAD